MIQTKPLPSAATLWSAMQKRSNINAVDLAAPWSRSGDTAIWLSRSAWGMAAMVSGLAEAHQSTIKMWFPEYFCDQALWPIRQREATLHFYAVDRDARPDWNRIELNRLGPQVFVLVHYFGHANDSARARELCDGAGALLVEDAAQALGPASGIGEVGDFVFYSPYKFFEAPNGALMLLRPRAAAWVEAIQAAVRRLGAAVSPGLRWAKHAAIAHLERFDPRSGSFRENDFLDDVMTVPMPRRPMPSPVTKPIFATVDVVEAGRRRRENDAAVRAFFKGVPGWEPLFAAPAQGPMRSVFRLDSPEPACIAYKALRRAGVEAEAWPTLPPEVKDESSQAKLLRNTVIYLPCHQGLTPAKLIAALERARL